MRTSGQCPKCQSDDIAYIPGSSAIGRGMWIGLTVLSNIPVSRFVCCNCGFIEEYVEYTGHIETLKWKFKKQKKDE